MHTETLTVPDLYLANTEVRFIPKDWGDGYMDVDNVHIELFGPTAVTFATITAKSAGPEPALLVWLPVLIVWGIVIAWMLVRRKNRRAYDP